MPRPRFPLWVSVSILLCALSSFSQDRGSITGVITDPSGAAVPVAMVTATNVATGTSQTTQTTSAGFYTVPELPAGIYRVRVEKTGFRIAVADKVEVIVNTATRIDLPLSIGATTQTVEVTAAPELLQTDRTDTGSALTTNQILNLPLSLSGGLRSNMQFLGLTAGVINSGGGDNGYRVAGGLGAEASQLLDGGETMSGRQNDPTLTAVSVEAVQEFKLVTGSFSAEYGRTANGVQNFVTKSGGNQLHGSVFEYFRNNALDSRGFYNATTPVDRQNDYGAALGGPVYIPKVFDGRDKLFWYFALEHTKYEAGAPNGLASVPTMAMRQGDFTGWVNSAGQEIPVYDPATTVINPTTGAVTRQQINCNGALNVICPDRVDPTAQALFAALPTPINSGIYNNINEVGAGGAIDTTWSIKMDYSPTSKSHFSGLYSRAISGVPPTFGPIPSPLGDNFAGTNKGDWFRFGYDYTISPSMLNHFQFSGNWVRYLEVSSYTAAQGTPYAMSASLKAAIQLKGIPVSATEASEYQPGDGYAQLNEWVTTNSPDRTWEISDTLNKVRGRHSMKVGFEYLHTLWARKDCLQCSGEADFNDATTGLPGATFQTGFSIASMYLGLPSYAQYSYGAYAHWAAPYYAWFFQDDFKATHKLTINMGLRYEIPEPVAEKYGNDGNICLVCSNPDAGGIAGAIEFAGYGPGRMDVKRFSDTKTDAWGPRLGLAYQVTPSTVLRAGGGIYYMAQREYANGDVHNTGFAGYRSQYAPTSYQPALTLAQGFPYSPPPPNLDPGICTFASAIQCTPWLQYPYSGYAPYLGSWNVTAEHRFGTSSLLRLSYAASIGAHLFSTREEINQMPNQYLSLGPTLLQPIDSPAALAAGINAPYAGFPGTESVAQALRYLPQYANLLEDQGSDVSGHSTYHSMELSFEHQMTHGLWLETAYTWSKLIANTEGGNSLYDAYIGSGNAATQNEFDRRADKAVSNSDVPHRLVMSYVYDLPVGRGRHFLSNANSAVNAVLGGWRVTGVQQYQSGDPMWVQSDQLLNGLTTTEPTTSGVWQMQTERPNLVPGQPLKNPAWTGDPNKLGANGLPIPWINPGAFSRPAEFTFGDAPAYFTNLRAPGIANEDLSAAKDFFFGNTEVRKLTFQANFFNMPNRHIFNPPSQGVGATGNTIESGSFGVINSQEDNARTIQFMLRLSF